MRDFHDTLLTVQKINLLAIFPTCLFGTFGLSESKSFKRAAAYNSPRCFKCVYPECAHVTPTPQKMCPCL